MQEKRDSEFATTVPARVHGTFSEQYFGSILGRLKVLIGRFEGPPVFALIGCRHFYVLLFRP